MRYKKMFNNSGYVTISLIVLGGLIILSSVVCVNLFKEEEASVDDGLDFSDIEEDVAKWSELAEKIEKENNAISQVAKEEVESSEVNNIVEDKPELYIIEPSYNHKIVLSLDERKETIYIEDLKWFSRGLDNKIGFSICYYEMFNKAIEGG